jgi:signal-transduction protein with cAMP-binding, CBS, and nucleotidyltransferase domain
MVQRIKEVMTLEPTALPAAATVGEAARAMRDRDIGDVIVLQDDQTVCGIITDRDLVVRALAESEDPRAIKLADICSRDVATLSPDSSVAEAVKLMADKAIRRLPVLENGKPVGIVSIGDLAVERDPDSALADISAAPPNT